MSIKQKRFSYGLSAELSIPTMSIVNTMPEVQVFKRKIFHAYRLLIGFAVALALLLPSDARDISHKVTAWVDLVKQIIPYVYWIEQNSKIPGLTTVWFSIIWPLIFVFLLYVIIKFPYRCSRLMLRAGGLSVWRHMQTVLILLLFSWMAYGIFFERRFAVVKSATHGHARLMETVAIDSRLGLALLAPLLLSLCLVVWVSTVAIVLLHIARFFCVDDSKESNLK